MVKCGSVTRMFFCCAFIFVEIQWQSQVIAKRLLIVHPVFTGSHERVLRHIGEQLVRTRGFSVTQLRWLSSISWHGNSTVHVVNRVFNISVLPSSPNSESEFAGRSAVAEPLDIVDDHGHFKVLTEDVWNYSRRMTNLVRRWKDLSRLAAIHCHDMLGDRQLLQLLQQNNYDVVIVDLIVNECGLALAHHLKLPVVGFWGFRFVGAEAQDIAAFNMPSLLPTMMTDATPEMTFSQRIYNVYSLLVHKIVLQLHYRNMNHIVQQHLPGTPDVTALVKNVNTVLVHASFYVSPPMALQPNIHFIGCVECRTSKPLPQDLEEFMVSSDDHGVIVFSLGITTYDPKTVPREFVAVFLRVFSQLKQKVIMRIGNPFGFDVPSNVLLTDWFPQPDVLGHPKTRLFISHCGISSVMEALYNGVPVLGVPVFMDQGETALLLQHRGLGLAIDKSAVSQALVEDAVLQLLRNESYRINAMRVSRLWRREPISAMQQAIHWIELVADFRRLDHLRISQDHLSWFQYWLLDVFATVASLMVVAVFLCLVAAKVIIRVVGKSIRRDRSYVRQKKVL